MKWCVEASGNKVVEICDLFDHEGQSTEALWAAESRVLRYEDEEGCVAFRPICLPYGFVHRIQ